MEIEVVPRGYGCLNVRMEKGAGREHEGQNIEIGLDEYIEGDGVCLIEWPMYIEKLIPDEYLDITIRNKGGDSRSLQFVSQGEGYDRFVKFLKEKKC